MKRRKTNRRKQAQGFVFPMPLALFLVLITVISMTYLWMQARCEAAGVRIQQLEREFEQTSRVLQQEQRKWTQMKTLPNVRTAVARHGLNMDLAADGQIIQLVRDMSGQSQRSHGDIARGPGVGVHD